MVTTRLIEVAVFLVAAAAAGYWLARIREFISETTLVFPWSWSAGGLGASACVELVAAAMDAQGHGLEMVHYVQAVFGITPVACLLGAKRPQVLAWQFIVAALAIVLLLPLAQTIMRSRYDGPVELHAMWLLFWLGLLAVGIVNFLRSRLLFAAGLYVAAAGLLLSSGVGWISGRWSGACGPAAAVLVAAATWLAAQRLSEPPKLPAGVQRMWSDFVNLYGALWATRVKDRFNSEASQRRHTARLTWDGLTSSRTGGVDAQSASASIPDVDFAEPLAKSLLAPFVSARWIVDRARRP